MEKKATKKAEELKTRKLIKFLKASLVGFLFFLVVLVLILVSSGFYYLSNFAQAADLKKGEIITQVVDGFKNPYSNEYLNLLILGLDKRPGEVGLLTDTILLVSFNVETGDYLLFSIPRDLWLDDLKTKINALYYYGQQSDPNDGTEMVTNKVEEILKTNIDYTLVLEMADIEELVDMIGKVSINVERSFDDHFYPLDDGSGEVTTIQFKKGEHTFDGQRTLQFMRSRQSEDKIEGTDQARQARQKKVILAIRDKLLNSNQLLKSPKKLGQFYKFFVEEIKIVPEMTIREISSFWRLANNLRFGDAIDAEIPWRPEDDDRVLIYGYINFDNTYIWVMTPTGNDWDLLSDYYHEKLPK